MPAVTLAPRSCQELLEDYRKSQRPSIQMAAQALQFGGVGAKDVYNITAPFTWNGERFLLGRVESRETEHSEIVFFKAVGDRWQAVTSIPALEGLQDPCITFIDGDLVLGGVKFPVVLADGSTGWRMEFYRGGSDGQLRHCFTGPDKMKDIRLKQLANGKIAIFTRPQGVKGGRGKIGFVVAESLSEMTAEMIEDAPLIENQFLESEWGGANEVHLLKDGHLGVLGHIACFDEQDHRHYYPMVFSVNPENGEASELRIIAERRDFPPGPSKRADLVDVIFSGGLIFDGKGRAVLYAGLSDAAAAWLEMFDPFFRAI